jgi:hypothetical protein
MAQLWKILKEWEDFRTECDMNFINYQNSEYETETKGGALEIQNKLRICLDGFRKKLINKYSLYNSLKEKTESDMNELSEFLKAAGKK